MQSVGSPRVSTIVVSLVFHLCQNCCFPQRVVPKCSTRFDNPSLPCPIIFFFVELNYAAVWCSLQDICTFHIPYTFTYNLIAAPLHFLYLFLPCTCSSLHLLSLSSLSIYYHVATELSVIYTVHYSGHDSPYEPYLAN